MLATFPRITSLTLALATEAIAMRGAIVGTTDVLASLPIPFFVANAFAFNTQTL